jgi:hypothetical protein
VSVHEPIERLLTPIEVSELLGVPIKTLYRWSYMRRAGMSAGPEVVKVGGRLRYRPGAIRDYLEAAAS